MIKNYFRIAWRNLFQNKVLSFINIFGLATGMAFALLICLWIRQETSYDTFHENRDRIALVMQNSLFNDQKNTISATQFPVCEELKTNYPEVKRATKLSWNTKAGLLAGNNKFTKSGIYADPDFLEMFSFPVIKGDAKTALNDPNSIILTESLATALFGTKDPIGQLIKLDNRYDVQVTAVMKDIPKNSTITFEFLAPYEFQVQHNDFVKSNRHNWANNFMMNMVELKAGASMDALSKKIGPVIMQRDKSLKNQTLFLQPMQEWHLYGDYKNWVNVGGKILYVRLFGIIGIFVLLVACINFMNLSTARSEKRAKEVGIRKAIGSRRIQLVMQFLSESMLTAFLAFLLAICLIQLLLPLLKDIGFEFISLNLHNAFLLAAMFIVCLATGLIAGSYPALYLSSFLPVRVLKGAVKQGQSAVTFRRVLVISQFVISTALIISTVIVFQQIRYAQNRSLGYNPNNLLSTGTSPDLLKNYDLLKQDLLNSNYVEAVVKTSQPMTTIYNRWGDFSWEGKDPKANIALDAIMTDWDFEKTAGLKFKQGRPFSRDYKTDSNGVILNEAALRIIGYKDPIGKTMKSGNRQLTIVGIVENILLDDPFKPVTPLVILFNHSATNSVNNILIRLKPGADLKKSLAAIQPIFETYNPAFPFEYNFVDDDFDKKFVTEKQVGKLAGIFAGLAIFISCMGLFGLAMFMAERRTKEIGIRKILGASVINLWMLLSKEFIWLVMIACLIASPFTFWFMKGWLQNYDYHINISGWIFIITASLGLVIALLTVSTQAIKAAFTNPIKSLRSE
ncbi:ABC-type antimicrobial peptide transport system permease subunit [Chitinophaga niastensis]|uniref:ABC-type antimicrobial peptide transport system permease subunit n=1 Tax=Chitinophaga niastensis TaxID=536980 RepID=A0A2P8HQ56_CHINA|nr:ABC transporter permease [Chitinophaga niastensis]PSL48337.1 ABC-type antimicrobial peptide transport system permease subunit [Chitinophaga niastensis]